MLVMIVLHRGSNEFGVHVNRVVMNGVLVVIVGKLNGDLVVV